MIRFIILDNEAVQALMKSDHPKHNDALDYAQVVQGRKKKAKPITLVVPTCVRVEAGWDRTAPNSAFINGLGIRDVQLDTPAANTAAEIRDRLGDSISVTDAHVGAVVQKFAGNEITIITSDKGDMEKVSVPTPVVVQTI